jgi:hypothetical protein
MPTLSEKEVTAKFRTYKRQMIKALGRKATTDKQLTTMGKKLFGKKYIGTFSQNYKVKSSPTTQMFVINTDTSGGPGEHWIAVLKNNNTFYVYDSFARTSKKIIPVFSKNKLIIESDRDDAEQRGQSEVCGQLCLSWLCVAQELGIRNALKI